MAKKDEDISVTQTELKYILDVNQKAIEIYVEVEKQNEQIIDTLEHFKEVANKVEYKLNDINNTSSHTFDLLKENLLEETKEIKQKLIDLENSQLKIKEISLELKEKISDIDNKSLEVEKKITDVEKSIFKLVIAISSTVIATVVSIIQLLMKK